MLLGKANEQKVTFFFSVNSSSFLEKVHFCYLGEGGQKPPFAHRNFVDAIVFLL